MPSTRTPALPRCHPVLAAAFGLLSAGAGAQESGKPDTVELARTMLETADEVMAEVEAIRGWKFKHPVKKDVRTEAELRAYIEGKINEQYSDGKIEQTEAWLKLLGLIPGDMSFVETTMDVLINQIGGFYDPQENSFFMMVESARLGDAANRMLIAHELCHALDDQHIGLDALMKPEGESLTEDREYAIGAVVEGSATALMHRWLANAMKARRIDTSELIQSQKSELERAKPLLNAPRYFSLIAASYIVGQHFITNGGTATNPTGTGEKIREVAKDMPRSTEQVLHPAKYWNPEMRDEPVQIANDDAIAAEIETMTGRHVVQRNTLGELVCSLLSVSAKKKTNMGLMGQPNYWTNRYSRGWGGDRMYLIGDRTAEGSQDLSSAQIVWITTWDSVEDREQFVMAMTKHRGETPGFTCLAVGKAALFEFGPDHGDDGRLSELLAAIRFEQDGSGWTPE